MNKGFKLLLFLLLFFSFKSQAQDSIHALNNIHFYHNHPFSNGIAQPVLVLDNEWIVGSNVMNRNMLFTGPNTSANEENRSRISNESTKRIGYDFRNELRYHFNHKVKEGNNYSYATINLGRRDLSGSLLSPDMAHLLLYGNADFLGKETELSFSDLHQISYNYAGYQHNWVRTNKGNRKSFQLGLKVIQANRYTGITLEKARLFTDTLGEYMTGELKGEWFRTGENDPFYTSGAGAAIDLGFQTTLGGNAAVSVSLSDLGLIRLKANNLYSVDSTIRYDGIVIDPTAETLEFDLRKEYLTEDSLHLVVGVPYTLNIKLHYRFSDLDLIEVAVENRNIGAFVQRFRASYARFLGPKANYVLISGIDVGGFGQYNWRETMLAQLNNSWGVKLGVGGIEGLVFNSLPMNAYLEFAVSKSL